MTPVSNKQGEYSVCQSSDSGATTKVVSNSEGKIVIRGLDGGHYQLVETKAPAGYQLLEAPVQFDITPKYNVLEKAIDTELSELTTAAKGFTANKVTGFVATTIVNKTGGLLPKTGGKGMIMIVIIGLIMIIIATVLMRRQRKQS